MIEARLAACLTLLLAGCVTDADAPPRAVPDYPTRVVAVGADAPAPTRDDFAARMLKAHNDARREAGLPPLRWNEDLARGAMQWAQVLARDGNLRHSSHESREGIGENVWMGTASFFTLEHMLEGMVDEKRDFRPGTFPDVSRTGKWEDVAHYTQIIWPTTREVGCALATAAGRDALVCRFAPMGNIIGDRVG
jgi:hypothetical protein